MIAQTGQDNDWFALECLVKACPIKSYAFIDMPQDAYGHFTVSRRSAFLCCFLLAEDVLLFPWDLDSVLSILLVRQSSMWALATLSVAPFNHVPQIGHCTSCFWMERGLPTSTNDPVLLDPSIPVDGEDDVEVVVVVVRGADGAGVGVGADDGVVLGVVGAEVAVLIVCGREFLGLAVDCLLGGLVFVGDSPYKLLRLSKLSNNDIKLMSEVGLLLGGPLLISPSKSSSDGGKSITSVSLTDFFRLLEVLPPVNSELIFSKKFSKGDDPSVALLGAASFVGSKVWFGFVCNFCTPGIPIVDDGRIWIPSIYVVLVGISVGSLRAV